MLRETHPAACRRLATLAASCALALLASGCGIKGPLKAPPGSVTPPPPPPAGVEMPSSVNQQ